jgi:anti-sigma-K factor RskA
MSGSIGEMEKFELLSAYLDGEVTADERKQVEVLLQEDTAFRTMHQRLRSTQQSFSHLPVLEQEIGLDAFADGVFAKVEQGRKRNFLKIGGGVVAAALMAVGGTIAATWDSFENPLPQLAKLSLPTSVPNSLEIVPNPAPLMVALNKPLVEIKVLPKADAGDDDMLDLLEEEI